MQNREHKYVLESTKIVCIDKMNREPKRQRERENQERHKEYKLYYSKWQHYHELGYKDNHILAGVGQLPFNIFTLLS